MEAYSTKSPFLPSALSAASRFLFRSNPEFIDSLLASWYTAKRSLCRQTGPSGLIFLNSSDFGQRSGILIPPKQRWQLGVVLAIFKIWSGISELITPVRDRDQ